MKVAVVKPDHVGDLVLSSAAIRAVLERAGRTTLFVASGNKLLAEALFGRGADIRGIDFPHLSKADRARSSEENLREFDLVVFLRQDNVINPGWAELRCRDYVFPADSHLRHQAMLDFGTVAPLVGHYDMDRLHFGAAAAGIERKAMAEPEAVGLCIGSGFHANAWPAARWQDLGRLLLRRGKRVSVVCGPAEAGLGRALAASLGLGKGQVIVGGAELARFWDQVGALDWVVSSDGGAGHLCSLRVPMLSVFGPSPFRRYAPFGRWNRLLTRDLPCSPCCQWTATLVNGCLSMECLGGIKATDVLNALLARTVPGTSGRAAGMRDGLALFQGVSHLELEAAIQGCGSIQTPIIPGDGKATGSALSGRREFASSPPADGTPASAVVPD